MRISNFTLLIPITLLLTLLISCESSNHPEEEYTPLEQLVRVYDMDTPISVLKSLPKEMDGMLVYLIYYYQNQDYTVDSELNYTSKVESTFNFEIDSAIMGDNNLNHYRDNYFDLYEKDWEMNWGPGFNKIYNWYFFSDKSKIKCNTKTLKSFGNISFSTNKIDLDKGVNIYWDNPHGEERIKMQIRILPLNSDYYSNEFIFIDDVENNGNYFLSPGELRKMGVNKSTNLLDITFYKGRVDISLADDKTIATLNLIQTDTRILIKH